MVGRVILNAPPRESGRESSFAARAATEDKSAAHTGVCHRRDVRNRKDSFERREMPKVMEYEDLQTSLPMVFDFVSSKHGVVTIRRGGIPAVRISPIHYYRTTEPDPSLSGEIDFDLFADESAEWENA